MPLPSPIPHPQSVFDTTGWRAGVMSQVIGESWPEADERSLRELAEMWRDAANQIEPLLHDAHLAASASAAALGGPPVLLEAWRRITAELDVEIFHQLAELVQAGAAEIEAAKLRIYTELSELMADLEILAATSGVTLGVSTMCAQPAALATRHSINQISRNAAHDMTERGHRVAKAAMPLGQFSFGVAGLELTSLTDASTGEGQPETVQGGDLAMAYGIGTFGGSMVGAMLPRGTQSTALKGRYGERAIQGRQSEVTVSDGIIAPPAPVSREATNALSTLDNGEPAQPDIDQATFTLAALAETKQKPDNKPSQ